MEEKYRVSGRREQALGIEKGEEKKKKGGDESRSQKGRFSSEWEGPHDSQRRTALAHLSVRRKKKKGKKSRIPLIDNHRKKGLQQQKEKSRRAGGDAKTFCMYSAAERERGGIL